MSFFIVGDKNRPINYLINSKDKDFNELSHYYKFYKLYHKWFNYL